MALKIRDARGGMLIEAVIVIAVIATLGWLSVRQSIDVAQTRADRASLEAMQELAAFYLSEARLADCAKFTSTSPPPPHSPCFAPYAGHVDTTKPPYNTDPYPHEYEFAVTRRHGRPAFFDVKVEDDTFSLHGISWPLREVTVTDSTGKLTLTRAAVGRP